MVSSASGAPPTVPPVYSRRRVLALGLGALGLAGTAPLLAGCTGSAADQGPDPLVALADRARADVALVTAAITADPSLTPRLDPLRSARADHARVLGEEIARLAGAPGPTTATPAPAPAAPPGLDAVRAALGAAAAEAAALVPTIAVERVGIVAAVASCCATYDVVLGGAA